MRSYCLRHSVATVIAVTMFLAQVLSAAVAQAGPRDSRGTQLSRGEVDPGRPMITACIVDQPCPFVGLLDPGAAAGGLLYLDAGYFTACVPGACGTPVPFLAAPAVAALGGGVSTTAITAAAVGATVAVGLSVGLGVGLTDGSSEKVSSPSQ